MTETDIKILKQSEGKELKLCCTDGEVLEIKVISVSESEGDVVYDLLSTNRPERYADRNSRVSYVTPFSEIDRVTLHRTELGVRGT